MKYEEESSSIPPPAIIIFPINPNTSYGWKNESCDFAYACSDMSGKDFIECTDQCSFSIEEAIDSSSTNGGNNYSTISNSCDWYNVERFYLNSADGLVQSVEIENDTVISIDVFSTVSFVLNNDLSYQIYIMDRRLQFVIGSPEVIPRSLLSWTKRAASTILYLKVIRHEKLNSSDKPCDPSPEYSLAECLDRSLIIKAGCQPPWRRVSVDDFPVCHNWTMLDSYDDEFWKIYNPDRKKLFEVSDCLMPCTFIEYKVSVK